MQPGRGEAKARGGRALSSARHARPYLVIALVVAAALAAWLALGSREDTPEAAFSRIEVAVKARDLRLLYDALEGDSRGAVDTVWRYQREAGAIVARDFPPAARARELRRFQRALDTTSARDLFAAWGADEDLFAALAPLGEPVRQERSDAGVTIATTTGKSVLVMRGARSGSWGYAALRDRLLRWADVSATDLQRVKEDAAVFTGGAR